MTVLAERLYDSVSDSQTQLVDDMGAMRFSGADFRVESDDETGGTAFWEDGDEKGGIGYRVIVRALLADEVGQDFPPRSVRLIPNQATSDVLEGLGSHDFTCSWSAPQFVGLPATGRSLADYVRNAWDALSSFTAVAPEEEVISLDVTTTLQQARSQAGLPVQDLAAMFGIKRRQLYNLMSGDATPDPARERRIARVAEAIARLSEQTNGNSKGVRGAVLARIDGDSVYDAAVSGDDERLDAATARALEAIGTAPQPRLAPSNRATSTEAAAVREFLRATRDETRRPSEP